MSSKDSSRTRRKHEAPARDAVGSVEFQVVEHENLLAIDDRFIGTAHDERALEHFSSCSV
jgi:hypothetical protein